MFFEINIPNLGNWCDVYVGCDKLLVNLMVFEIDIPNLSDDEEEDCDEDLLENREKWAIVILTFTKKICRYFNEKGSDQTYCLSMLLFKIKNHN